MNKQQQIIEKQKELINKLDLFLADNDFPEKLYPDLRDKIESLELQSSQTGDECEHPFAFVQSRCNGEINYCLKCGKDLSESLPESQPPSEDKIISAEDWFNENSHEFINDGYSLHRVMNRETFLKFASQFGSQDRKGKNYGGLNNENN